MRVRVSPSAPAPPDDVSRRGGLTAWTARSVAVAQALTPQAVAVLVPSALLAARRGRRSAPALTVAGAVAVTGLIRPFVSGRRRPAGRVGTDGTDGAVCRVAAANLLYRNHAVGAAADALLSADPDVVVFSEYTRAHDDDLADHPLGRQLPHRVVAFDRGSRGLAVWSRLPVRATGVDGPGPTLSVGVSGSGSDFQLVAVHTTTPIEDPRRWRHELAAIGGEAVAAGPATLFVGDFNAACWHPPFHRLLRDGLVDAHLAHRRPLSSSWPTGLAVPPFVRLDHALTGPGLVATAVGDLDVPGSDHRGLVVSVARAR